MILPFKNTDPQIGEGTKVFPNASVLGNVTIGKECSLWPGACVRSDWETGGESVVIGDQVNLQENVVVHVGRGGFSVVIGSRTTVGHGAIVHGCTVGEETLIGMGAILQNGVKVGSRCLIGSGALLSSGTVVPDGHLAYGVPARVIRPLTKEEQENLVRSCRNYLEYAAGFPDFDQKGEIKA